MNKLVYLIIYGVKLGEDNAIDQSRVLHVRVICQSLVKLCQLINSLVTHQSLSHKQNQIRLVHLDQLPNKTNPSEQTAYSVYGLISNIDQYRQLILITCQS